MGKQDEQGLWFVLDKIQQDISQLDNKWEHYLAESSRISSAVEAIVKQVERLTHLVSTGNGSKSLLVQVAEVHKDVEQLRDQQGTNAKHIAQIKKRVGGCTSKEIKVERLKVIGKVVGIVGLALPGILSWLG